MHTDDDIFESLNIDEGQNGTEAAGSNAGPAGIPGGIQAAPDPADDLFEDLDMEERIYQTAMDPDKAPSEKPAAGGREAAGGGRTGAARHERNPEQGHQIRKEKKSPKELNTVDSSVDRRTYTREKESKKRSRIKKILIWSVVEIITLAAIFAYGYFLRSWNMIARPEVRKEVIENKNISLEKKKEMEGYWNIAVFGVDSRGSNVVEKGLNSDVIMVGSINKDNGEIRLVSIFRDTYLNISEKNTYNKINQAYAIGGPEQALAALNKNLDLNIQHYVAFNWKAVAEGINILGGVDDIPISKAELYYINAYITETVKVTKIGSYQLKNTGPQHLDGVQAVAYGRLRYMDNDFARTERQRNIIKAAFAKAKKANFSVLNNIMVVCFPQVATNIDFNEVIEMAQNITKYNIADTGGFPWSRGDANIGKKGDCVVPTTLESNVVKLHEFLFGDTNYTPSDAVLSISAKIKSDSNLYKEGKYIESVATDGGVIQKPKNPAPAAASASSSSSGSSSEREEEVTLGVDEEGNYIYPTDEDGNIIVPTDEDGKVIYPTDEDGNIIKESSRPTELSTEDGIPGGSSLAPGDLTDPDNEMQYGPGGAPSVTDVNTNPTRETKNTGSQSHEVSPGSSSSDGTSDSPVAPTATANPGSSSHVGIDAPVISADGPGSLSTSGSSTEGPGGSSSGSAVSPADSPVTSSGSSVQNPDSTGDSGSPVSPGSTSVSSDNTPVSPGSLSSPADSTSNSPAPGDDVVVSPGSAVSPGDVTGSPIQEGP